MTLEWLGLGGVLAMVVVMPFTVRWAEEKLEAFLLVMGVAAVSISGQWSPVLLGQALGDPVPLAATVLAAGSVFRWQRRRVVASVERAQSAWGAQVLAGLLVPVIGVLSALCSAMVAALVLAEAVSVLRLPRASELRLVVLACFSIGLGSALSPLGGPLAAIVVTRLAGEPYHADFFFLARLLWPAVLGMLAVLGALAFLFGQGHASSSGALAPETHESWRDLLYRVLRVYLFVAGLVLLGQGFAPLAERWLLPLPTQALYWANASSAFLDNATLAAAEVGPRVAGDKLQAILLGLLLSGGMLVPGNVPNIICAAKLGIGAKEWARFGVPLGLALMAVMAVLLRLY